MKNFLNTLNFQDIKILSGIAAIATLMGVGVVSSTEGLPLLTGLVGLGINTNQNQNQTNNSN